jgi:hypothetical protein
MPTDRCRGFQRGGPNSYKEACKIDVPPGVGGAGIIILQVFPNPTLESELDPLGWLEINRCVPLVCKAEKC